MKSGSTEEPIHGSDLELFPHKSNDGADEKNSYQSRDCSKKAAENRSVASAKKEMLMGSKHSRSSDHSHEEEKYKFNVGLTAPTLPLSRRKSYNENRQQSPLRRLSMTREMENTSADEVPNLLSPVAERNVVNRGLDSSVQPMYNK